MPLSMSKPKGLDNFPLKRKLRVYVCYLFLKEQQFVSDRQRPYLPREMLKSKRGLYWPHTKQHLCVINFPSLNWANCVGVENSARSRVSWSREGSEHKATEREKNSR